MTKSALRPAGGSIIGGALTGIGAAATGALAATTYWWGRAQAETGFRLREETLEVLPAGSEPIRVLHISDLHLTPGQHHKLRWLTGLAQLKPDLVINTGDNLGHPHVNGELLEALAPLLEIPGIYVPGSNDYYGPRNKNPIAYFSGPSKISDNREPDLPWEELFAGFGPNWTNLTNTRAQLAIKGVEFNV